MALLSNEGWALGLNPAKQCTELHGPDSLTILLCIFMSKSCLNLCVGNWLYLLSMVLVHVDFLFKSVAKKTLCYEKCFSDLKATL
jgi:hypothetical protein